MAKVDERRVPSWHMKGEILGTCNCDWGCPCNFDAPPTFGYCDGVYGLVIREGRFGGVDLGGVRFAWGGHSPGPIHEGGLVEVLMLDDASTPEQREAIQTLWNGGGVGSPFDEFASLRATPLGPLVAPIEVELAGMDSRFRVAGGAVFDLALTRVKNPVTGEEEELYLDKPTGFTSTRSELGTSEVSMFVSHDMSFDLSGKYAEWAEFSYRGP
ncbi:MAG TPA: DUF1326 domain-containing protein [Actinomycetota bacterium]|nr:DUF1326 domain-containing protein [Actinomycetota bacterium]